MDISKLKIGGNIMNIKDSTARDTLVSVENKLNIEELEDGDVIAWDSKNGKFVNTKNFQVTVTQLQTETYARCTTESEISNKVATITNFPNYEISVGSRINVIFENENTAQDITLQIFNQDGSSATGEIPIVAKNSANLRLGNGSIKAGTYSFSYNGTFFVVDTCIVEQTETYTKYADSRTEYEPISTLTDNSPAPVNTNAVKGALEILEQNEYLINEEIDTVFEE